MDQLEKPAMLLECADWVEVELAERLLAEAGIPSARDHGVFAGLLGMVGYLPQNAGERYDLRVPAAELDRARAVLAEAWNRPRATGPASAP